MEIAFWISAKTLIRFLGQQWYLHITVASQYSLLRIGSSGSKMDTRQWLELSYLSHMLEGHGLADLSFHGVDCT